MTNHMYLTASEAKQMNLPNMSEQIARYNAAVIVNRAQESTKQAARLIRSRMTGVADEHAWRILSHAQEYLWSQVRA